MEESERTTLYVCWQAKNQGQKQKKEGRRPVAHIKSHRGSAGAGDGEGIDRVQGGLASSFEVVTHSKAMIW